MEMLRLGVKFVIKPTISIRLDSVYRAKNVKFNGLEFVIQTCFYIV